MKKYILIFIIILLLAGGGVYFFGLNEKVPAGEELAASEGEFPIVFPIAEYASRRTVNAFGEESQVTLDGYHAADDIEYADVEEEVPAFAIADGIVRRADWVKGYGGVIVIGHTIGGKTFTAIYGHIDLSSTSLSAGDSVSQGELIAYLGEGGTLETDDERKHLHFALYQGEDTRIQGYEPASTGLQKWINPQDFFAQYGLDIKNPSRMYNPETDLGGEEFVLEFLVPEGWEVEYDDSARILNVFTLSGEGSSRERSQIVFAYFDASQFLTLSTVTIHGTSDLVVGKENYTAKRYDIEKRPGAAGFQSQPSWRSGRHIAIDFRDKEGRTRYWSIAKNPQLDEQTFQRVLDSIKIVD